MYRLETFLVSVLFMQSVISYSQDDLLVAWSWGHTGLGSHHIIDCLLKMVLKVKWKEKSIICNVVKVV